MKIESCKVQPVRMRYDETCVTGTHLVVRLQTDAGIEGISFVGPLGGSNLQPLALLIGSAAEQVKIRT